MKKNNLIFAFISLLVIALFLGGVVYGLNQLSTTVEVVMETNAVAFVEEKSADWGNIKMYDAMPTQVFKIKNTGTQALKLYQATTSCACTTVQIRTTTQKTPNLSMHSNSNQVIDVMPGQEAEVEVVFNPAFHGPSGVGAIERVASMKTNDPNQPELQFTVTGFVTQ